MKSRFTFMQGAQLVAVVLAIGSLAVFFVGSSIAPTLLQPKPTPRPAYYAQPAAEETTSVTFPPGNIMPANLKIGWYEICDNVSCARGYWTAQEFIDVDKALINDITGKYIYPMLKETDLVAETTYSLCSMPESALWIHANQAEQGTYVDGCVVGTYKYTDDTYHFDVDGEPVWFPWVSDNTFQFVLPITR